jgi:hypothetical protein
LPSNPFDATAVRFLFISIPLSASCVDSGIAVFLSVLRMENTTKSPISSQFDASSSVGIAFVPKVDERHSGRGICCADVRAAMAQFETLVWEEKT